MAAIFFWLFEGLTLFSLVFTVSPKKLALCCHSLGVSSTSSLCCWIVGLLQHPSPLPKTIISDFGSSPENSPGLYSTHQQTLKQARPLPWGKMKQFLFLWSNFKRNFFLVYEIPVLLYLSISYYIFLYYSFREYHKLLFHTPQTGRYGNETIFRSLRRW